MLEKTGMLELTPSEVDEINATKKTPSRIRGGWDFKAEELVTLVKAGEYRLINTSNEEHKL